MSDTTNRNVTVTVSLVNGNMSLGPIDTSSIMEAIRQVQAEAAKIKVNPFEDSVIAQGRRINTDVDYTQGSRRSESSRLPADTDLGALFGIDISKKESQANNPDEISWKEVADLMKQPSGGGRGSSSKSQGLKDAEEADKERSIAHKKYLRDRAAEERAAEAEYDKIAREGLQSYSKIMAERRAKEQEDIAARRNMLQGIKGLAILGASTDPNISNVVQNVVMIEGAYKSLDAVAGGMGASLANPYVLLAAAVGAAALSVRQLTVWTREFNDESLAQTSEQSGRNVAFSASRASQAAGLGINLSRNMPVGSLHSLRQLQFAHERGLTEQNIRGLQDTSGRDLGWRQEIRHREETKAGLREQRMTAADAMSTLEPRQAALAEAARKFEMRKREAEQGHAANLQNLENQKKEIFQPSSTGLGGGVDWFGEQVGGWADWARGDMTQRQRGLHNKELSVKKENASAEFKKNMGVMEGEGNAVQQEQNNLLKQRGELAQQILMTSREQVRVSRQIAEADREGVTNAQIGLGAMDQGDVMILENLQDKVERIKAQKAKRAQGQNVDVEEMMPWENQLGLAHPELTMFDDIRGMAQERGKNTRLQTREGQAKKAEDEAVAIEKANKNEEPELLKVIQENAEAQKANETKILDSLKKAVTFAEIATELEKWAAEGRVEFEKWKVRRQSWFGSG